MRLARVLALSCAAYALVGCGTSQSQQVQAKLQQFAHAVADRDTAALCDDVLAPALIAKLSSIGASCRPAMKTFVDSVSNPTLSVSRVTIHDDTASAVVRAGATGQATVSEPITLTRTTHGWRVSTLASAR